MRSDLPTSLSPEVALERLEPIASEAAWQDHRSGEIPKKPRRRAASDEEAELDIPFAADEEPEHKIDSLA